MRVSWLGALVAGLWPFALLLPGAVAHAPVVQAPFEQLLSRGVLAPVGMALEALAAVIDGLARLLPLGPHEARVGALSVLALCALAAALHVALQAYWARFMDVLGAPPLVREPLALGVAWAVLALVVPLELVVVRMAPLSLLGALVLFALSLRRSARPRRVPVEPQTSSPSVLARVVALTAMVLGAALLRSATQAPASLRTELSESIEYALVRNAPPRALLLVQDSLAPSLRRFRGLSRLRPDIELHALRDLKDPARAERLAVREPMLLPLIRASLLRGALDPAELSALATQRTVRLAPDLETFTSVRETLLPASLFAEVGSSTITASDLERALSASEAHNTALVVGLALGQTDPQVRALVRQQCVLTAALLAPSAHDALLDYLDRARMLATTEAERAALLAMVASLGMPAGAVAVP